MSVSPMSATDSQSVRCQCGEHHCDCGEAFCDCANPAREIKSTLSDLITSDFQAVGTSVDVTMSVICPWEGMSLAIMEQTQTRAVRKTVPSAHINQARDSVDDSDDRSFPLMKVFADAIKDLETNNSLRRGM